LKYYSIQFEILNASVTYTVC